MNAKRRMLLGKGRRSYKRILAITVLLAVVYGASFEAFVNVFSWVASKEGLEWSMNGLGGWVREVEWSPSGEWVAVAVGGLSPWRSNGSIGIYDRHGVRVWSLNVSSPVTRVEWYNDSIIVFIEKTGLVGLVDVADKRVVWNRSLEAFMDDLTVDRGDGYILVAADLPLDSVVALSLNNGSILFSREMNGGVLDVGYNPSRGVIYACSAGNITARFRGEIILLDSKGETLVEEKLGSECIKAYLMKGWGKLAVATGFPHYMLKLMDTSGDGVRVDASVALGGLAVDLHEMGDYLVIGVGRPGNKVLLFRHGLTLYRVLEPGRGMVTSVSVDEGNEVIAVTTEWFDSYLNPHGGVFIYDIHGKLVGSMELKGRCSSSDWSPQGRLAIGTKEGGLYVLNPRRMWLYSLVTPLSILVSLLVLLGLFLRFRKASIFKL